MSSINIIQDRFHNQIQQIKYKKNNSNPKHILNPLYLISRLKEKYKFTPKEHNNKLINELVYNEKSHIVAIFKEFLILDDNSEFLKRFYLLKDSILRLPKINSFYESYTKIFPNYTSIKESKFLYDNIKKKQMLIDQEMNNKNKNIEKNNEDMNFDSNTIFNSQIKNSIMNIKPLISERYSLDVSDYSIVSLMKNIKINENEQVLNFDDRLFKDDNYIKNQNLNTEFSFSSNLTLVSYLNNNISYECIETPKKSSKLINYQNYMNIMNYKNNEKVCKIPNKIQDRSNKTKDINPFNMDKEVYCKKIIKEKAFSPHISSKNSHQNVNLNGNMDKSTNLYDNKNGNNIKSEKISDKNSIVNVIKALMNQTKQSNIQSNNFFLVVNQNFTNSNNGNANLNNNSTKSPMNIKTKFKSNTSLKKEGFIKTIIPKTSINIMKSRVNTKSNDSRKEISSPKVKQSISKEAIFKSQLSNKNNKSSKSIIEKMKTFKINTNSSNLNAMPVNLKVSNNEKNKTPINFSNKKKANFSSTQFKSETSGNINSSYLNNNIQNTMTSFNINKISSSDKKNNLNSANGVGNLNNVYSLKDIDLNYDQEVCFNIVYIYFPYLTLLYI